MSQALDCIAPTQVTITKLVIETKSPMAIYTGRRETGFDNELVRDINGLPMIPATAIAGVWRHLVENTFPAEKDNKGKKIKPSLADYWFGYITAEQKQAASTYISHGQLLDSCGQKVANYTDKETMLKDEILRLTLQNRPHHRERVSINDRGVAKQTGKFDQLLLPAGMRFAVTLEWNDCPRKDGYKLTKTEWLALLNLWQSPYFAFGSNTRNGLGRIDIVYSDMQCFNLTDATIAEKINVFRQSPINQTHALKAKLCQQEAMIKRQYKITLQAKDYWRCGSGIELLSKKDQQPDKQVAIKTYSESRVSWETLPAKMTENQAVLCGSSIKGILAHRIAFHYHKLKKIWADGKEMQDKSHQEWQQRPEGLKNLLGFADDKDHFNSISGALWVEDAKLNYEHTLIRTHNSIDRFTGGVRKGALFSEELLYQPIMTLTLNISRDLTQNEDDKLLLKALENTIQDLERGLLPFGAGSGRGASLMTFIKKEVISQQENSMESVA